jgi:hypothetical protein
MGILDDAIREHLDLKRRQGAADSEIQRLEDEAFGPPSRPGDPDFPETGESESMADGEAPVSQAPPVDEVPVSEPPPVDEAAPARSETGEQEIAPEPETGEEPAGSFFDQTLDEPPAEAPASAGPEPADAAPVEEVAAQPPLDIDDPAAHLEVLSEPPRQAEPPPEPPIESLDTVEHHFEGAIEDTGEAEVVEAEPVEEPPATGEEPLPTGEEPLPTGEEDLPPEGEDEDVLEETPEFLRDQPEDDELWFEQGEPKDFDF